MKTICLGCGRVIDTDADCYTQFESGGCLCGDCVKSIFFVDDLVQDAAANLVNAFVDLLKQRMVQDFPDLDRSVAVRIDSTVSSARDEFLTTTHKCSS